MKEINTAWNPGLESDIPPAYRSLETIYRAEVVSSLMTDIDEISRQTALSPQTLVVFRPDRLALHQLIVRTTADIVVLEGKDEIELGRNFRQIIKTIFSHYIQPHIPELTRDYEHLRKKVYRLIEQEVIAALFTTHKTESTKNKFFPFSLRNQKKVRSVIQESTQEREHRAISLFQKKWLASKDSLNRAIFKNLYRILESIAGNRGYLGPDREFLINLVCDQVCNTYGSDLLGQKIAPLIESAIASEGYPRIPNTEAPLLISLKGASAAGKSSLRPLLKQMMSERGIQPGGYAIISPDIWRRLLLDYDSLGEAYKYAGRLTSHEVIIIDGKLDRYIRSKADRLGAMPHLLVDRFRFDSFSTDRITKILHGTYVKHINTLYMYFVVTPPHATVERGWERGLNTGRYKAVEDFLDHSVEAYIGMPKILFKWLAYDHPQFKYHFLDNSVPKGTYPRTIAYGTQHEMNIVNCSIIIDIERYQKINIQAKGLGEVYPSGSTMSVENNVGFLKQCIKKIPLINFIDQVSENIYMRVQDGEFKIVDNHIFEAALKDTELNQIFMEVAPQLLK